jgi:hypothetical protein
MIVVALMVSSVMVVPPCELSWIPDLTRGAPACLVLLPESSASLSLGDPRDRGPPSQGKDER